MNCPVTINNSLFSLLAPRVAVIGDSGTGKSTFVKFLVNYLISKNSQNSENSKPSKRNGICLLDVDPGQPEKSLPGVLTVGSVSKPMLGSAYTYSLAVALNANKEVSGSHEDLSDYVSTTGQHFFGSVSPDARKSHYVSAVSNLMDTVKLKHSDQPLIINTMGYISGQGLHFIIDLFKITKPTHVINLRRNTDDQFSRINLIMAKNKNEHHGTFYAHNFLGDDIKPYKYLPIEPRSSLKRTKKAAFLRELIFLSYVSALCPLDCDVRVPSCKAVVQLSTRKIRFYDFKRGSWNNSPILQAGDEIVLASNFKSDDFVALSTEDVAKWTGNDPVKRKEWLEIQRRQLNRKLRVANFIGIGIVFDQDPDLSIIRVLIPRACLAERVVGTVMFNTTCLGEESKFIISKLFNDVDDYF